jgi:hypothetical protein
VLDVVMEMKGFYDPIQPVEDNPNTEKNEAV